MRVYFVWSVIVLCFVGVLDSTPDFRQERAKVKYVNPKYISNVSLFTGRKSRRDPYLTNLTYTTLLPMGNNISLVIVLDLKGQGQLKLDYKLCEAYKIKWVIEFVTAFSDQTGECPLAAGTYKYHNMVLPPKNFPLPMTDDDCEMSLKFMKTLTNELILEMMTYLRTERKGRKNANL